MSLKNHIIHTLAAKGGKTVSATELGGDLSRNAVWKAVCALKEEGYPIESVQGKGYRLGEPIDFPNAHAIEELTEGKYKVEVLESATSTNSLLRELAEGGEEEGAVIIARSQSDGRGRMGRSFLSKDGGLYMSLLLRPELEASKGGTITAAAAVAVAEAIEALSGKKAHIKWVNDIFVEGKKVCGILTEGAVNLESGTFNYAVVGIGLNIYRPKSGYPQELKDIAGALYPWEDKRYGFISSFAAEILKRFDKALQDSEYVHAAYKKRCFLIGQRAVAVRGNDEHPVLIKDVDKDYALVVEAEGKEGRLNSGEVRIRPGQVPHE